MASARIGSSARSDGAQAGSQAKAWRARAQCSRTSAEAGCARSARSAAGSSEASATASRARCECESGVAASSAQPAACTPRSEAWARIAPATCTSAFAATSDATPPAAATSAQRRAHPLHLSVGRRRRHRLHERRRVRRQRRRGGGGGGDGGVARRRLTQHAVPPPLARRLLEADEQAVAVHLERALRQLHAADQLAVEQRRRPEDGPHAQPWPCADLGAARRLVLVAPHVAPVVVLERDVELRALCARRHRHAHLEVRRRLAPRVARRRAGACAVRGAHRVKVGVALRKSSRSSCDNFVASRSSRKVGAFTAFSFTPKI